MNKKDKLRAFFNKKLNDTVFYHPSGYATKSDAAFLYSFFTPEFKKELEDRGYDWKTFKFEISPKNNDEKL